MTELSNFREFRKARVQRLVREETNDPGHGKYNLLGNKGKKVWENVSPNGPLHNELICFRRN